MDKNKVAEELVLVAKDLMSANEGHYHVEGNKIYVDSTFVNNSKGVLPRSSLEHMGFGEFYLETPNGRVDFDRMRGKDFDGQSGRSHLLTDDAGGKLVKELVKKMTQSGNAIEASIRTAGCEKLPEGKMREMCEKKKKSARSLEALSGWVDDDVNESLKYLDKANRLITNISRNGGGRGIKKLNKSLTYFIDTLSKMDNEDLEE